MSFKTMTTRQYFFCRRMEEDLYFTWAGASLGIMEIVFVLPMRLENLANETHRERFKMER